VASFPVLGPTSSAARWLLCRHRAPLGPEDAPCHCRTLRPCVSVASTAQLGSWPGPTASSVRCRTSTEMDGDATRSVRERTDRAV